MTNTMRGTEYMLVDPSREERVKLVHQTADAQPNYTPWIVAVLVVASLIGIFAYLFLAQTPAHELVKTDIDPSLEFSSFAEAYGLPKIPREDYSAALIENLRKLRKEPCNWDAMHKLGLELSRESDKRLAALSYRAFPSRCQRDGFADREAASTYFKIGEYEDARKLYASLVERYPEGDLDWYHKAQSEHQLGMTAAALDSFANMFALTRNQKNLGDWVFNEMSRVYAEAGRYCEAITPISTFISLDPAGRDNDRNRQIISTYVEKGHCNYASGSDSFPVGGAGTISVRGSINGTSGTFLVDTGASFVALSPEFAKKANLALEGGTLSTQTANGTSEVKLLKSTSIHVGRVKAEDVTVVMLNKPLGNVDALLGRSFLSRFNVTFDKNNVVFKSK